MNRRHALKVIGTGLVTSTSVSGLSGAETQKLDGILVTRQSSPQNPLTRKDAEKLADRARRKYFATFKEELQVEKLLVGLPRESKALNVAGLGIYISPAGRSDSFIGMVPDAKVIEDANPGDGIKAVRSRMSTWRDRLAEREAASKQPSGPSISSADWSHFEIDQDFDNPVARKTVYVGEGDDYCPHGKVTNQTGVYEHPTDGSVFAAATESDITTGARSCTNNDWGKGRYDLRHQWQSGSYDTGTVTDRLPNGYKGTSQESVGGTIGYTQDGVTASVSYSHTKSYMEIFDNSDDDEAAWEFNWTNQFKSSKTVNATSFFNFNSDGSYSDKLMETYEEITFNKYEGLQKKRYDLRTDFVY